MQIKQGIKFGKTKIPPMTVIGENYQAVHFQLSETVGSSEERAREHNKLFATTVIIKNFCSISHHTPANDHHDHHHLAIESIYLN